LFCTPRRAFEDNIADNPGVSVPLNKSRSVGYHRRFVTAFPDIHFEVLHVLAEGDHVLIHWTGSGTHAERLATATGETIPPTRRRVRVSGAMLTELRYGKIARVVLLRSALAVGPVGHHRTTRTLLVSGGVLSRLRTSRTERRLASANSLLASLRERPPSATLGN
jgi:predicted ester cyclase